MAIFKRKADIENNKKAVIYALIRQIGNYDKIIQVSSAEENTYQWNNFVRDLLKDENTSQYKHWWGCSTFIVWNKVCSFYDKNLLPRIDEKVW